MGFAEDYVVDAVTAKAQKTIAEKTDSSDTFFTLVYVEQWKSKVATLFAMLAIMAICAGVDIGMGGKLHKHGIYPRSLSGALGIPLAPFLHVSLTAFVSNMLPLLLLGSGVMMRDRGLPVFAYLFLAITALAGVGVWAFGEDQLHTGSNALVFGFFAYLVMNCALTRTFRSVVIALIATVAFGPSLISSFIDTVGPAAAAAAATIPGRDPLSWMYMGLGAGAGALFAVVHARVEADGLWGFVEWVRGVGAGAGARPTGGRGEHGSAEERESLKGYNRV